MFAQESFQKSACFSIRIHKKVQTTDKNFSRQQKFIDAMLVKFSSYSYKMALFKGER